VVPPSAASPARFVVIADDFTGAAELAGLARARGLSAEVQTYFEPRSKAEVLALDTDTRGRSPDEAAQRVAALAAEVFRSQPAWVYQKTDSVLRGHVRVEIEAIVRAGGLHSALLVPANPSRGRIIRGGEYFIQGVPLEQTAFARDPEHPRLTARVAELLGASPLIRVPDTVDAADLQAHAGALDTGTLPAGGVDFFAALLTGRGATLAQRTTDRPRPRLAGPVLFVCGSAVAWRQGRETLCERWHLPCLLLPPALAQAALAPDAVTRWAQEIQSALSTHGRAMAAIGPIQLDPGGLPPSALCARLADAVVQATGQLDRGCLCVEGGATARAVVDRLGCSRWELFRPWAPGVVELRPAGGGRDTLICKVGSYEWPEPLLTALMSPPPPWDPPVHVPVEPVLDLHTFRPEDLGVLIPEYLEQCRARGLREVRLIHGKGIGNVRRGVEALLRRLDTVESFTPAGALYGGPGATLVKLRMK
jgi:uncharacterized protein YgbK (DUF1537 family)